MSDYRPFQSIPRLTREVVITEKIDGTNAQVVVFTPEDPDGLGGIKSSRTGLWLRAGSRIRWITPDSDNMGFARWAYGNVDELTCLGPGQHFGEWWGAGIQRRYGLAEKRFSLFNVSRWTAETAPKCCHVVPIIARGDFTTSLVDEAVDRLRREGSLAAPGFMNPEGVIVFHTASGHLFKKTIEKDDEGKGWKGRGSAPRMAA